MSLLLLYRSERETAKRRGLLLRNNFLTFIFLTKNFYQVSVT